MDEIVLSSEQIQILALYKRQLLQYLLLEEDAKLKKSFNRIIREVIKIDDFFQLIEKNNQEINLELPEEQQDGIQ